MQEEVTGKTVTLIVNGAKMSEQVFEKAVKKFLEEIQKSRQPKIYRGKQTQKTAGFPERRACQYRDQRQKYQGLYPCGEEIPCGFCLEKGHRCRTAPLPGLFQKPGRGRHHGGFPGVRQPQDGPGGKTRHPGPAGAGEGTGGAETGAPDTGPGESQNQGSERAAMNIKKLILTNLPYLLFAYPFDKLAQAFRLAPGADLSAKLLSIQDGFSMAFASPAPSLEPADLLIGIAGALILRLAVYMKGKNAKKYRHGMEYGSARWSA